MAAADQGASAVYGRTAGHAASRAGMAGLSPLVVALLLIPANALAPCMAWRSSNPEKKADAAAVPAARIVDPSFCANQTWPYIDPRCLKRVDNLPRVAEPVQVAAPSGITTPAPSTAPAQSAAPAIKPESPGSPMPPPAVVSPPAATDIAAAPAEPARPDEAGPAASDAKQPTSMQANMQTDQRERRHRVHYRRPFGFLFSVR